MRKHLVKFRHKFNDIMRADRQTKRHTDTLIGTLRPPTGDDGNSVQWVKSMELNDWWKYYRSREFLANVNSRSRFSERELTFTFAILCRPSVRLSSDCLSVCNVRAPYSARWNFRQFFFAVRIGTLAIPWHPRKNLRRSPQGNLSVGGGGGLNARGVAKCSDFWHFEGHNLEKVQDRT